ETGAWARARRRNSRTARLPGRESRRARTFDRRVCPALEGKALRAPRERPPCGPAVAASASAESPWPHRSRPECKIAFAQGQPRREPAGLLDPGARLGHRVGGKLLPFRRTSVLSSEASRNPVGLPDFKSGGPF